MAKPCRIFAPSHRSSYNALHPIRVTVSDTQEGNLSAKTKKLWIALTCAGMMQHGIVIVLVGALLPALMVPSGAVRDGLRASVPTCVLSS